jgi:hypothetical protein
MNTTGVIRFMKHAAIAMVAAAGMQVCAQTLQDGGVVADPSNPPPGNPIVSGDVEKAGGGAHFTALYVTNDLVHLVLTFLSGQQGVGPYPGDCHYLPFSPYTLTLSLDGTAIYTYSNNLWNNVTANLPPDCGLNFYYTNAGQYEVLAPGTYQVKVTQGASTLATAQLVLPACIKPIPMYSARHDAYTDNFYTTLSSDLQQAISLGYHSTGVGFEVSRSNQKTAPWKRYFIGSPQLEHFYTHLADEEQFVTSFGYVYERDEGNIFPTQLAGTLPLYRLSQFFPATSDLQHVYTTSSAAVASYQQSGYGLDGVKGYVCP